MTKYTYRVLSAFLIFAAQSACGESDHKSAHGTLITLMGNKQGVVVVVDSMGTSVDGSGHSVQLPQPFQKLMSYDEGTVCATAGLLISVTSKRALPNPRILPQLNLQVLGVVQGYRDAVKRSGQSQSIQDALVGLSGALRARFTTLADLDSYLGHDGVETISKYQLRLRLAGFDLDGNPKIGSLDLTVIPELWSDGQIHWTAEERESPRVEPILDALLIRSTGIDTIEKEILAHPERFTSAKIMRDYVSAMRRDQGASLSTEDMKQLGHFFKLRTARIVREVGGPDQVAIIVRGRKPELKGLDSFRPIANPVQFGKWVCSPGVGIQGAGTDIITGATPVIFQSCTFERVRIELANNIFIHCTFKDVELIYDGGNVLFDDDNMIEGNSRIRLFRHSEGYPEITGRLLSKFDFLHGGTANTGPPKVKIPMAPPNP